MFTMVDLNPGPYPLGGKTLSLDISEEPPQQWSSRGQHLREQKQRELKVRGGEWAKASEEFGFVLFFQW